MNKKVCVIAATLTCMWAPPAWSADLLEGAAVDDDPNATNTGFVSNGNQIVIGASYNCTVAGAQFSSLVGVNLPRVSQTPPFGKGPFIQPGFTHFDFQYRSFGQPLGPEGVDPRLTIVVQTADGHYQVGGSSVSFNQASAGNPHTPPPNLTQQFSYWDYQTPGPGSSQWKPQPGAFANTTVISIAIVYAGDSSTGTIGFAHYRVFGATPTAFFQQTITATNTDTMFNFGG